MYELSQKRRETAGELCTCSSTYIHELSSEVHASFATYTQSSSSMPHERPSGTSSVNNNLLYPSYVRLVFSCFPSFSLRTNQSMYDHTKIPCSFAGDTEGPADTTKIKSHRNIPSHPHPSTPNLLKYSLIHPFIYLPTHPSTNPPIHPSLARWSGTAVRAYSSGRRNAEGCSVAWYGEAPAVRDKKNMTSAGRLYQQTPTHLPITDLPIQTHPQPPTCLLYTSPSPRD